MGWDVSIREGVGALLIGPTKVGLDIAWNIGEILVLLKVELVIFRHERTRQVLETRSILVEKLVQIEWLNVKLLGDAL